MSSPIGPGGTPFIAGIYGSDGQAGDEAMSVEGGNSAARLRPNRPVLASKHDSGIDIQASLVRGNNPADGLDKPRMSQQLDTEAMVLDSLDDSQVSADIYTYMALFQKMAQQMRNTAREQRTAEFQGQISSLQSAAEKMKEAAGQRFAAAIVQGVTQIASGLVQAGMSTAAAAKTIKGAQMEMQGKNALAELKAFEGNTDVLPPKMGASLTQSANQMIRDGQVAGARGGLWQGYAQAGSGITGGIGGLVAAGFNHKADLLDADKTNLETQAKMHETAVQHANDMMQQMMDVIRDVRDKLSSIQQSQVETTRGIARNI